MMIFNVLNKFLMPAICGIGATFFAGAMLYSLGVAEDGPALMFAGLTVLNVAGFIRELNRQVEANVKEFGK
jgi:hypothetical protein